MQDRVFLDTNILLYALSTKEPQKQKIAKDIVLSDAFISTQVINEVSVNLLKKFAFSEEDIRKFLYSEDMHHGLSVSKRLQIINPFL